MFRQSRAPILLTRPEAQGERFAAMLAGERVVISPLFAPVFLAPPLPDADCVIFTSATAIAALRGRRPAARAWCVGARTAELARAAGFEAMSADGDADALVAAIIASGERGPMLHLHGAETRGDVAARLRAAGIRTEGVVIYEQRPVPPIADAVALLAGDAPVLVPLFSPAAAKRFAEVSAGCVAPLRLACLSAAVARAAPPATLCRIAARPDAAAMVDLIAAMQSLET